MTHTINGTKVEDGFTIEFIANPKRSGFKAHGRYEIYQSATTIEEYIELADKKYAKADLRYDEAKGYLTIFDTDGEIVNAKEEIVAKEEEPTDDDEIVAQITDDEPTEDELAEIMDEEIEE